MDNINRNIFRIQRIIAVIAFTAGFVVFIINLIHSIELYGPDQAFFRKGVLFLFISSIVVLSTGFINNKIARLIQLGICLCTGALAIIDNYESIFGLGLFLLSAMIAFRYGYFKKYLKMKALVFIISTFILIFISAGIHPGSTRVMLGLDSILYMTLFLFITYMIYSDEINSYISITKKAELTVVELIKQREQLQQEMDELNTRIEQMESGSKPINLRALGITSREEDVLRTLIIYREKEEDIAKRLGIGYQTVKTHFKHIRDKLGVDRREEIIDMCRHNF